ncbi:DMT family transporter [Endozoicomonadaceae bacterium StTr2]
MFNSLLYLGVLLAWGGSWLAIKWQGGDVPTTVSIFYRFVFSALILLIIVLLSGRLQRSYRRDHGFYLLQGLCLFSMNFVAFYLATQYIASGLVAVTMSTATLFNAVHNRWIWGISSSGHFKLGSVLGIAGLVLLLWSDLEAQQWSGDSYIGIGFALLGTWLFSLGNMIGVRHARRGLKAWTTTLWGMIYGCLILALISSVVVFKQYGASELVLWDNSARYLGSLLYLVIVATVLGFTAYLMLVARIGANYSAYALVITPVVALTLSSLFEGFVWSTESVIGLVVIMTGNLCVLGEGLGRLNGRLMLWSRRSVTPER